MNKDYLVIKRLPSIEEYIRICTSVGWKDFINFDVAEESLKKSLFGVIIKHIDEVIGMGRIVGDGQIYFYIQDVAVDPTHQGQGIGRLILESLTEYLKENAPEKAFVGLFAYQGKEAFYNRYGLNKHEGMTGMFGVVIGQDIL
ncbi:GNAT family N-acetyltransferase [Paenibacillus fonticola]|uniref:GNAT family N-acetyltransferase n=1 Tax=Paenibacillus fonticola TaxID=379896 RepID=UPI00037AB448|nr:GNAT family N-acetyltransferase [Paenibacillus fonticola]